MPADSLISRGIYKKKYSEKMTKKLFKILCINKFLICQILNPVYSWKHGKKKKKKPVGFLEAPTCAADTTTKFKLTS